MKRMTGALVILALCAGAASANLVKNPGYEEAICTTWSPANETTNWFGWGDVEGVGSAWKNPHDGVLSLVLKNWMGGGDGVEQKPFVTADTAYQFSFYSLWDSGYDGSLDVQVRWIDSGGSQIGSNIVAWAAGAADTWNLCSVVVTSMTGSARAEINFNNSGGTAGALYLDDAGFDVYVVPEPATATLLGIAGVVLACRCRRKA